MSKGVFIIGAGALAGLMLLLRSRPATAATTPALGLIPAVPDASGQGFQEPVSDKPIESLPQSTITPASDARTFTRPTANVNDLSTVTVREPALSAPIVNAISSGQSLASLTRTATTPVSEQLAETRRLYSALLNRADLLLAEAGVTQDRLGIRSLAAQVRRDPGSVSNATLAQAADNIESGISPVISAVRRDNVSAVVAAMAKLPEVVLTLTLQLDQARLDVGRRNTVGLTLRSELTNRLAAAHSGGGYTAPTVTAPKQTFATSPKVSL